MNTNRVPTIPKPSLPVRKKSGPEEPMAVLADMWNPLKDFVGVSLALIARYARTLIKDNGTTITADEVATLVNGKVPSAQLPSYVDDVLENANFAAFPVSGSTGIIYVAIDTGIVYRWSGSAYVAISTVPDLASQAEAEAGTNNTKLMTPLRVAQEIDILGSGMVNVKAFGALGDARKVTDAVLNSSTTVTSATANFTAADIGKQVWGCNTSTGAANLTRTTITAVTNSTTIIVANAAGSNQTGIHLVLGTDDTVAIKAAATAADVMIPKGTVYAPRGGYVFNETLFRFAETPFMEKKPSIMGDGSSSTFFFPAPDITLTSNTIFAYDNIAGSNEISGLTVDGSYMTTAAGSVIFTTSSANYHFLHDVRLTNFFGTYGVSVQGATSLHRCHIEAMNGSAGVTSGAPTTLVDCYVGNCGYCSVRAESGGTLTVIGGILDESNSGTIYIGNTSSATVDGATVFAGSGYTAVVVDTGGTARISNSRLIPFTGNTNVTGLSVAATGVAYISQCVLTGNGTGYGLNNAGTVYGGGNNVINTTNGTAVDTSLP